MLTHRPPFRRAHVLARVPLASARASLATAALVLSRPPAALAWSLWFGCCFFSDGPAQELVRTGSCANQKDIWLNERSPKIASLPAGVFDNMGHVR